MTHTAQIIQLQGRSMADTSDGWFKLSNTLSEMLCRVALNGREFRYLNAVIHKTIGYKKQFDWIAAGQMELLTGINPSHQSEIKRALLDRDILIKKGRELGINLQVDEWVLESKYLKTGKKELPDTGYKITRNRIDVYPIPDKNIPDTGVHNKKDNITQEDKYICSVSTPKNSTPKITKSKEFKNFFDAYPDHRKGGTDKSAWDAWKSEKLTPDHASEAINWLTAASENQPDVWGKSSQGQYCLGITKFIRSKYWKTPVPQASTKPNTSLDWDDKTWADDVNEGLI